MTMIKKIARIVNFGSFSDFDWGVSIPNKDVDFKDVNILYGRNYSGKTTLSRILQALEKGKIPEGYEDGKVTLVDDSGNNIEIESDSELLKNFPGSVRVFNRDFVQENLKFVYDGKGDIKSFAVIVKPSADAKERIAELKKQLGSEEEKSGAYGELLKLESRKIEINRCQVKLTADLSGKLTDKARDILQNSAKFGLSLYNKTHLEKEIEQVNKMPLPVPLALAEETVFLHVIQAEEKARISHPGSLPLNLRDLAKRTKSLVEKTISITKSIKELADDPEMQNWVRYGMHMHRESGRKLCGFCTNELPSDLWSKLDAHFSKESETLRKEIESLTQEAEHEKERVVNYCQNDAFRDGNFYRAGLRNTQPNLHATMNDGLNDYCDAIKRLITQLEQRESDIMHPKVFSSENLDESKLRATVVQLLAKIDENNKFTANLVQEKLNAKNKLRLNEVRNFIDLIDYRRVTKANQSLDAGYARIVAKFDRKKLEVDELCGKIEQLEIQQRSETKGAEKINNLLCSYFGHAALKLRAVPMDDDLQLYKFEVWRKGEKASNLSEGECNLIAFCYFIAKLDDTSTVGKEPIIWIDDPVSSLDSSHIFFVYSLILAEIVEADPKRFTQLFVSTHNLTFLKYLTRWPANTIKPKFFLVEHPQESSVVTNMPKHLKRATEFNYLFKQIRTCARADIYDTKNVHNFLNFGNNARKFLEVYLYYHYPNTANLDAQLSEFFGKDEAVMKNLTARLVNQLSHTAAQLEKGSDLIDRSVFAEVKRVAECILNKIKTRNKVQYNQLLQSIGEKPED